MQIKLITILHSQMCVCVHVDFYFVFVWFMKHLLKSLVLASNTHDDRAIKSTGCSKPKIAIKGQVKQSDSLFVFL